MYFSTALLLLEETAMVKCCGVSVCVCVFVCTLRYSRPAAASEHLQGSTKKQTEENEGMLCES